MIRIVSEASPTPVISSSLEDFLIEELEKAADLSDRMAILQWFSKKLPARWFRSLIEWPTFLKWLDIVDHQCQKWARYGRPPGEYAVQAFMGLTIGMGYEDVREMLIEEALLRPTRRSVSYEKSRELARRKQAVTKAIYRVKESLEAAGFSIRYRPKLLSQRFLEILKVAVAKQAELTRNGTRRHRHTRSLGLCEAGPVANFSGVFR